MSNPSHSAALGQEVENLLALADAMEAFLPDGTATFLKAWRGRLKIWQNNAHLESLDGDKALNDLTFELRYQWLHHVHALSDRFIMSPPHSQRKILPNKTIFGFPYDRWLKPVHLERRLANMNPAPDGWASEAVVFSSGMSALTTLLQHLRAGADQFWPATPKRLGVHWFGGYFEITRALHLLCDARFQGRRHANQDTLFETVAAGNSDIVLIEPVAADIGLEIFDLDAFIAAWKKRDTARPCWIIVDTSLTGDAFPIDRLCRELSPNPPQLVAQVRSGLKLDQEGLELGNVGLVNVYTVKTAESEELLNRYADSLRLARTTLGASLSQNEFAALSAPFFLDANALTRHSQAVFANNAAFAQALAPIAKDDGALWTEVIHPCLSNVKDRAWAVAPYVNLRYRETGTVDNTDVDARDFLRRIFEFEAHARNLSFVSGSSFGFRGHRFEMGFVRGVKYSSLRVALGRRAGPSLDGIITLFQDLAAYPDFAALAKAYAHLLPKPGNA